MLSTATTPQVIQLVYQILQEIHFVLRQYRIILSADTASEVRQMPSQKRR